MKTLAEQHLNAVAKFQAAYGAMLDAADELRALVNQAKRLRAALVGKTHGSMNPRLFCIKQLVADDFELPISALDSVVRTDRYVVPRHIAMVLSLRLTQLGSVRIGLAFRRDHGTVLNAKRSLAARLEQDAKLAERFAKLEATAKEVLNAA